MSGMFMINLSKVDLEDRSAGGFKILFHRVITDRLEHVAEVPIWFGERTAGRSKATLAELRRYLVLVLRLRLLSWQRTCLELLGN
jgi:hypothetical protein